MYSTDEWKNVIVHAEKEKSLTIMDMNRDVFYVSNYMKQIRKVNFQEQKLR